MSEKTQPVLNPDAFRITKSVVMAALDSKITATHGRGFFGSPSMIGGKLNGMNQWYFGVGGAATTNAVRTGKQMAFKSRAIVEGVFMDVDRAFELIPRVHELLPIENDKSVRCLYSDGGGCETVALEFFDVDGRDGKWGLYHVKIPLNIVIDFTYFLPTVDLPLPGGGGEIIEEET